MHVNKYLYARGGAEIYMLRTAARQRARGDEVQLFGGRLAAGDVPLGVGVVAVPTAEFHELAGIERVAAISKVLWNRDILPVFEAELERFRPDVVHLHNYAHQLSSSLLQACRKRNIRTINTAHDYKLICPSYVANVGGEDCFACARHISPKLLLRRTHHGRLSWSALVGAEAAVVRSRSLVADILVAPSRFMRDALRDSWLEGKTRIELVRNPVDVPEADWIGDGGYLLYVGRLSREKGVVDLARACRELNIPVKFAGEGPASVELDAERVLEGSRIEMLGHVSEAHLRVLRRHSRAQVVSSTWPENAPLSALEAASQGVPLLVTERGGLSELAEVGVWAVSISGVSSAETARGLELISAGSQGDRELMALELAWPLHLDALSSLYLGTE